MIEAKLNMKILFHIIPCTFYIYRGKTTPRVKLLLDPQGHKLVTNTSQDRLTSRIRTNFLPLE